MINVWKRIRETSQIPPLCLSFKVHYWPWWFGKNNSQFKVHLLCFSGAFNPISQSLSADNDDWWSLLNWPRNYWGHYLAVLPDLKTYHPSLFPFPMRTQWELALLALLHFSLCQYFMSCIIVRCFFQHSQCASNVSDGGQNVQPSFCVKMDSKVHLRRKWCFNSHTKLHKSSE